jgi:hypothetical protein
MTNQGAEIFRGRCRAAAAFVLLAASMVIGRELYTGRARTVTSDYGPEARYHGAVGRGPREFWRAIRDKLVLSSGAGFALFAVGEAVVIWRRRRAD